MINRHHGRSWKLLALLAMLASCVSAFAHPMGNFSINHESKITLHRQFIELRYLVDLAEIPTYQELQLSGISSKAEDSAVKQYANRRGEIFASRLLLEVDGQPLALKLLSSDIIFPPGAGGLPTMKFGFVYRAKLPQGRVSGERRVHFADNNFADRAGWKEVVIESPDGPLIHSSAPQSDRSAELSNYPTDLTNSPPQQTEAIAEFTFPAGLANKRSGSPSTVAQTLPLRTSVANQPASKVLQAESKDANPQVVPKPDVRPNIQKTPRSRFTELIAAEHLNTWFVLTALLIALGLGALHALEPGHGKTIVAAYLVGSRGSTRDAVLLGTTVTIAHTAGVYLLGLITLYASRYVVPEKLYPWLAMLSGLLIVGLGLTLFLQHFSGAGFDHKEDPEHPHSHWGLAFARRASRPVAVTPTTSAEKKSVPLGKLLTLGISGGIIPCPAALVVLLSAVALHRIGFGLVLILAFSFGLAGVLIAIGILMVHARKLLSRFNEQSSLATRWLPILSSVFITGLGAAMLWQPISALGLNLGLIQPERAPAFLAVIGLGLLLGMRHSTDADHVVAVTTIVSQQRKITDAALIGALWGVGHTLTIFAVGAVIILFNVAIPPRVGLSLEFSVAIMLIVLGVLNLTGIMQWITQRFTPSTAAQKSATTTAGLIPRTENLFDRAVGRFGIYQIMRPFIIGTVHGLAGSAAVALLVLATISTPLWAVGYLLIFGLGTVLGMMVMTAIIALPFTYSGRFTRLNWGLRLTSGIISMAFGLFLAYHIGFIDGLFTSSPQWTPR